MNAVQPIPGRNLERPLLLVVSAPSGAGKSTLCRRLLQAEPRMRYSVSATTRAPRGEEQNGRHYHFLTADEFARREEAGEFLERATVHGHRYGTLRGPVLEALGTGHDIIMDIDVQGGAQIREVARRAPAGDPIRQAFVDVFILPPSLESLKERLLGRGEDSIETVERRVRVAQQEMARWTEYRYVIVNDSLDEAFERLRAVVRAERCRVPAP